MFRPFTRRAATAAIAICGLLLTACSTRSVTAANDLAVPKTPTKIVSLSPTATETLFAIGADEQVIAVDDQSNYPKKAPGTKLSSFNLSVEAVAKYKPDLVVIAFDTTAGKNALDAFAKLKIPVLLQPAAETMDDVYSQITELGKATGHSDNADKLVATMKTDIANIVESVKTDKEYKFFHEVDSTLYSATSKSFIGRIYADFGLKNIADVAADADSNGYPQLTNEIIVQQNPDLIFLGDAAYGESLASVSARPGWGSLEAVAQRRIIELDSDIASRWGPRVVDLYRAIAAGVPVAM